MSRVGWGRALDPHHLPGSSLGATPSPKLRPLPRLSLGHSLS